jgi:hypothetical protein
MALAVPWIFLFAMKGGLIKRASLDVGCSCPGALRFASGWPSISALLIRSVWRVARQLSSIAGVVGGDGVRRRDVPAGRSAGHCRSIAVLAAGCTGCSAEHIPGELGHSGLPVESFLGTLVIAEGGMWGQPDRRVVSMWLRCSSFSVQCLNAGEAGQGFMNLALASAGRLKAGAAKVSVLASSLFGSISGSASANVASTGSFTLPAMKRLGYPPSFAAAVEAVASAAGRSCRR